MNSVKVEIEEIKNTDAQIQQESDEEVLKDFGEICIWNEECDSNCCNYHMEGNIFKSTCGAPHHCYGED